MSEAVATSETIAVAPENQTPETPAPKRSFPPLDQSLYRLDELESTFFKSQTGIQDDEELKSHILEIQDEAYAVRNEV